MRRAPTPRRATLGLALLSIITFGVADLNLPLLIVAVPGALAAWFFTQPPLGKPLPRIVINLLLMAILAYTLFTVTARGFTVTTVCEIITLTLVAKILDRRSQRDQGQVVSISAFLCIGTILTSNGFWVGMLLIACLGFLIAATVNHQIERVAPTMEGPRQAATPSDRTFRTQRRRLVGLMFAVGLIMSVVVFLTIPRKLGAGLFGEWGNPSVGQVTGFADEVELGTPGLISQSSTPVLDYEVLGRDGLSLGGPGIVYYLRGAVLDVYEDGRWMRDRNWNEYAQRKGSDHLLRGFAVASEPRYWNIEQRITVRNAAATRSHLFSVWRPVFLEPAQPSSFQTTENGTIIRESDSGKFEYTVLSRDYEQRTRYEGRRQWTPARPVVSEDMDTERFRTLAARIVSDADLDPDPATRPGSQVEQAAGAIRDYFNEGFLYTLEAEPVPPGLDPTEWFLFDRKTGHCEYYASAMSALCRSIGINARVITGYVATEYNEATGHYVVRQSNAHAWVEAEVGPGVWYTFDPTPPADFLRVHERSDSLLAQALRLVDAAEYAWIRAVVGFDADSQQSMVRSAFKVNWTPDRAIEDFAENLREGGPKFALKIIGALLLAISALTLGFLLAARYRGALLGLVRRLVGAVALSLRPREDVVAIYQRLLRELDRRGRPKPMGVPLLTHVRAAFVGAPPEERDAGERLARTLYRARFDEPDAALAASCARDLAILRSQNRRPSGQPGPSTGRAP